MIIPDAAHLDLPVGTVIVGRISPNDPQSPWQLQDQDSGEGDWEGLEHTAYASNFLFPVEEVWRP